MWYPCVWPELAFEAGVKARADERFYCFFVLEKNDEIIYDKVVRNQQLLAN